MEVIKAAVIVGNTEYIAMDMKSITGASITAITENRGVAPEDKTEKTMAHIAMVSHMVLQVLTHFY